MTSLGVVSIIPIVQFSKVLSLAISRSSIMIRLRLYHTLNMFSLCKQPIFTSVLTFLWSKLFSPSERYFLKTVWILKTLQNFRLCHCQALECTVRDTACINDSISVYLESIDAIDTAMAFTVFSIVSILASTDGDEALNSTDGGERTQISESKSSTSSFGKSSRALDSAQIVQQKIAASKRFFLAEHVQWESHKWTRKW